MPNTVCSPVNILPITLCHAFRSRMLSLWHNQLIHMFCCSIVKEAGRSPPPFPFIFFKPATSIVDHGSDVIIPKIAQDDQADYEGELVQISSSYIKIIHPLQPMSLTRF